MIKLYKTLLLFLLLFCRFSSYAQPDCVDAINICADQPLQITPNGAGNVIELTTGSFSNPSTNPGPVNSLGNLNQGCFLFSNGINPTWMIINIAASGSLEFTFGADNGTACLDWIMWPYSPTACNEIIANTLAPIRCNWNAPCEGFTGMANVLPPGASPTNFQASLNATVGQQFLICLSNFSGIDATLPLSFPGTANISCTPPLTVNNPSICPGESAILTANFPGNPSTVSYSWSTGETTQSIIVSPLSTSTYTVTANGIDINGSPISNSEAISTVTVNPPINPTFSQIQPFCNNSVVTAVLPTNSTNLPPISGTWNPPTVSSATVGSQVYTFTPTNIYCANTATMTVITIPNGTASVNPINTLCINSVAPILPTTSTNTIPYQGTWNPPIISTSTAGIFPYTFTPTPGLCGAPTTINITIQEVATFNQIPQLCQEDLNPILPTISNNTPGITGVWNPATIDSSIPGVFTHTFLPNSGQCQTTVDMNITIVPAAPPSFIADTLTGCNPLPVIFQL